MKGAVWAGVVVMVVVGCNSKNDGEGTEYYYYPQKNVYYNPGNNFYYYSINGGKQWDSILNRSNDEPTVLGDKVLVYSTNSKVYSSNEQHREKFQGVAYNFASIATAPAATEVSERKLYKKPASFAKKKSQAEEKPKKGIKKFFSKLFGK